MDNRSQIILDECKKWLEKIENDKGRKSNVAISL